MRRISGRFSVGAGVFAAALLIALVVAASAAGASGRNTGFGFNANNVAGFPTGRVFLTGGGAFNASSGFAHSAGGFRCTASVNQGPLAGFEPVTPRSLSFPNQPVGPVPVLTASSRHRVQ